MDWFCLGHLLQVSVLGDLTGHSLPRPVCFFPFAVEKAELRVSPRRFGQETDGDLSQENEARVDDQLTWSRGSGE